MDSSKGPCWHGEVKPVGTVTVTDDTTGKSVKLPLLEGTEGPRVIDIR